MGGMNNAKLEYDRRTFAERTEAELSAAGMPCYLSVAAYEQELPEGWTCVRDCVTDPEGGYIGPMGGMYSCLKQAREDGLQGLFFVPCDAPLYDSAVTLKLGGYTGPDTDAVLWRTADGRLQTAFGWYSVGCLPAMEEDIGNSGYKILRTLDRLRCRIVDAGEAGLDDRLFMNINDMEDYGALQTDIRR